MVPGSSNSASDSAMGQKSNDPFNMGTSQMDFFGDLLNLDVRNCIVYSFLAR